VRSPILAALLHSTPAAGVSQTLRRGTRHEITELSHMGATYLRQGGHQVGHRPTFSLRISDFYQEGWLNIYGRPM